MEKSKQQYIDEKGVLARNHFLAGYNCAQAVAIAFAEELHLEPARIAGLVSAFGGGMGRMREVCGTVSGMLFVIGAVKGYDTPGDQQGKKALYTLVQEIASEFRKVHGSIICRDLLSGKIEKISDTPEPTERTPEFYQKRPCPELAAYAAALTAKYLLKEC